MNEWWICYDKWPGPIVQEQYNNYFRIDKQIHFMHGDTLCVNVQYPDPGFNVGTMILNADGTEIGLVDYIEQSPEYIHGIKAYVHL